ncbi:hypothetical protein GNF86_01175 [Clostridium perfringens]
MRVKKFVELCDFDTALAITTTDECEIIKSPNDKELNKKVKYFEIKNDILILHV